MAATSTEARSGRPGELLERSSKLADLERQLELVARSGAGRVVLIAGEAGIGKTALMREFCASRTSSQRLLWGACVPLFTPRPLGPVREVAEQMGVELEDLVGPEAKPFEVGAWLLRELAARPAVLVLEDLHWADEASLDVLRTVARRIETVPALVLVSYREDDLARGHPFRKVLGELARQACVTRLRLERLSPVAVAALSEPYGIDAEELYRTTAGNPFFVTEVLAAGDERIPATVRDAVLARAHHLTPPARALLDTVAIESQAMELSLLENLAPGAVAALDECLAAGMLTADDNAVAFRHELARLAVEESLAPDRRYALHRAALAALADPPGGALDLPRLAHHAAAAGDADAVLRFAPAAAQRASALGAHREAAAHYARALRHAEAVPIEERARLFDRTAHEYGLVGRLTDAAELRRQAIESHRAAGDRVGEGNSLRALVWLLWVVGRREEAEAAAREAVAVLEQCPPGRELGRAYGAMSLLRFADEDLAGTTEWGTRALALAEESDDRRGALQALINIGAIEFLRGDPKGREKLERMLERARDAGLAEDAAAAFCWLARAAVRSRRFRLASEYVEAGIEYCSRYDLEGWRPYLIGLRAEQELEQGDWQAAADSATLVLRGEGSGTASVLALVALGRLRARRGDPGCWSLLDRALELAQSSGELGRLAPVAAARAEAAWLEGRDQAAVEETELAWDLARSRGEPWLAGELAQWRRRAGAQDEPLPALAEPYALALAGEWRRASELWNELGCPYEAALTAAEGDDAHSRRALDELHGLGASITAAVIGRRLRERGTHGLPRGPRRQTSRNPAQLTAREIEVLGLLAGGLRNAEIADRLFISARTVDHHVSAILRKLEVGSRGEAVAAAARLGVTPQR
jgi:DNA-binding CsgD family transcriptional regulator